jgi:hypothetical protein
MMKIVYGINESIQSLEAICNHYSSESSSPLLFESRSYRSKKVMNFVAYKTMLIAKKHCGLYLNRKSATNIHDGPSGIRGNSGTSGGTSGTAGSSGTSCPAGTSGPSFHENARFYKKMRVRW